MGLIYVGLGGLLGALSRYGIYLLLRSFAGSAASAATLAVNVAGCLAIGAVAARARALEDFPSELWLFAVVGFLGSFTTYSAFGLETLDFLRAGRPQAALLLVMLHLTLGLGAVWLGFRALG